MTSNRSCVSFLLLCFAIAELIQLLPSPPASACTIFFAQAFTFPNDAITAGLSSRQIQFRQGRPEDELPIAITMGKEFMNPLGISHKNNLIIAEDVATGDRIGWAQIRSMGYATVAIADPSKFEDDDNYNSNSMKRRDVQSTLEIEQDVDELMLQEFEDEPIDFPNGFASLPWTKDYQAASKAADDRLKRRERILEKELLSRPKLWELSSVYVQPKWRHQGIGTELVKQVLECQRGSLKSNNQQGKDIYALTLAKTMQWYEQLGFVEEKQIPNSMALEVSAGNAITKLLGEELVCMRTTI